MLNEQIVGATVIMGTLGAGLLMGAVLAPLINAGLKPNYSAQPTEEQLVVVEDPATDFSCIRYPDNGLERGKIVIRF